MRQLFVVVLMGLNLAVAIAQSLDYKHKSINKELNKVWGLPVGKIEFKELPELESIQGKYFSVGEEKYIYVGRVNSCRAGGCAVNSRHAGSSEYFDYFILFDGKGQVVATKVYNYAATHGYEITSKGWLKQFVGFESGKSLEVGKDVDTISGATISVYAITDDIIEKTSVFSCYLRANQ